MKNDEGKDNLGSLAVKQGLTDKQIDQLIEYANSDPKVIEFSSDSTRFANREAYNRWLKKGRSVYSMTDESGDLLGIIWYGREQMPAGKDFSSNVVPGDYGVTFAIRVYGAARGKHLAGKFMLAAQSTYVSSQDYSTIVSKGIWLETSESNIAAVTAYRKFGYRQVTQADDKGKILMVLPDTVSKGGSAE
jgi:ribosomal protein S18 acetylase RimI-like enzyme